MSKSSEPSIKPISPAPGTDAAEGSPASTPFVPNIERVHLKGPSTSLEVGVDQIKLSTGQTLWVNSTKGEPRPDGTQPPLRTAMLSTVESEGRRKVKRTQYELALAGEITPCMEYAALRESAPALGGGLKAPFDGEQIRAQIAAGEAVLPCNVNHPESEPMVIGKAFSVKVNANFGASQLSSGLAAELEKLRLCLRYGADTVMDLSTGQSDLSALREAVLRASPVPVGTVPVYEALDRAQGEVGNLSWELFYETLLAQARQGVDYFTIHAGLTSSLLDSAARRTLGIVSRGGSVMAAAMLKNDAENLAWEHFDEILALCHDYDVALSLGDGLRPGCLADACDEAQYGELKNLGTLVERCHEAGVQCFIEGPGHVPLDKVEENQRLQEQYCHKAPFYTLGPLVTDIAPGYDHITSAIGGAQIAKHGTAMLCYVTPSEHLALPTAADVVTGLITYKLAAHAADVAKGLPGARLRDDAMAQARDEFRWFDQFTLSLHPQHAYEVWAAQMPEHCAHEPSFCSMCGPRFCPIRLNRRLRERFGADK